MSESVTKPGIDPVAAPSKIESATSRFLERFAYRIESGLSEHELAEEMLIEALLVSRCSYGYVLRTSPGRSLEVEIILSVKSNGRFESCNEQLRDDRPDPLISDVMATLKPAYNNSVDPDLTVNIPENHPPINSFAVFPLADRSALKGILVIANPRNSFNVELLGRLQAIIDALLRIYINSVQNQSVQRLVSALGEANQQWTRLLEALFDSVITIDANWLICSINAASERLFDVTARDVLGSPVDLFISRDTLSAVRQNSAVSKTQDSSKSVPVLKFENVRARNSSGKRFPVQLAIVQGNDAVRSMSTLVIREIGERRSKRQDKHHDTVRYQALTRLVPFGLLQLNKAWLCEYTNDAWCRLTGRDFEANLDNGWIEALHPDDQPHILMHMRYALLNGRSFQEVMRLTNAAGETIKVSLNAASFTDESTGQDGSLITIMESSGHLNAKQHIKQLANYDALTDLPNRSYFLEHLATALSQRAPAEIVALLFIDLDGFKAVNDTMGQDAGDTLLQQVAMRLRHTIREDDTLARLGGDEFSCTVSRMERVSDAGIIAEAIIHAVRQPFLVKDEEIYVSASIGIAVSVSKDKKTTDKAIDLIKQADVALYRAKLSGRSRYVYFTEELDKAQRERSILITGLRRAVERQDFELYYQPQLLIKEQQLLGFEALLRWPQALDKNSGPSDYIGVLEDTGLIGKLGEWAIGQACSQHRIWRERGLIGPATTMSVNVSASQLRLLNFASTVATILDNQFMRPDSLILEITESALVQTFETNIISDIKSMGVQISLDDFGTGYSSLAYLSQLPLDHLKIDRSFITDISKFPHAITVIKSIIALANTLGIRVIAEGVEDPRILPLLAAEGCEGYQGYYFSEPVPADLMTKKLQELDPVKLSHYANFIDLDNSPQG
ncbi:MAG: EAL domain-containing protein [Granulosicoccus sp.]|nr:EAL domain-containing protein [Granulosicoccus sp.]